MIVGYLFRVVLMACAAVIFPHRIIAQGHDGRVLPTISSRLIGSSIATDSAIISAYAPLGEDARNIKNVISFYIREADSARTYLASPFTATIVFDLESTVNNSQSIETGKTLVINFDTTTGAGYNVRAYIVLPTAAEK